MRTLAIFLLVSGFGCSALFAQDRHQNGVFLTESDFNSNILSMPSLSESDSLIEAFAGDIHLVRDGHIIKFRFGEIYGYRDRGFKFFSFGVKRGFRIYGYYQILDETPLFVYSKRVPHVQYHYVQAPYFSLTRDSPKYALTKKNLRRYAHLSAESEKKVRAVKDRHDLAKIIQGRCVVNELITVHPR